MPSPSRILARVPIATAVLFCTLFVVVPLCVVVGQTFFDDDGFTLRAWTNLVFEKFGGEQLLRSLELGVAACAVANLFGFGHAWLCERTDLPFARQLGPLAILPLVIEDFDYVLCLAKKSPQVGLLQEFERVIEVMRAEGAYRPILERYGFAGLAIY